MTNEVSPIFKIRGTPVDLKDIYTDFCKIPFSKLRLITIKDNAQRYVWTRMDKPRKWLDRFCSSYFIVRSPVGGYHFHALACLNDVSMRVYKGIHINILPVGEKKETMLRDFSEPYHEPHPCRDVCYRWGVDIMEVNQELRLRFGFQKTSLPSRLRAKRYRQMRKLNISDNIGRIINYLVKNANENLEPMPYDDYIYKRLLIN